MQWDFLYQGQAAKIIFAGPSILTSGSYIQSEPTYILLENISMSSELFAKVRVMITYLHSDDKISACQKPVQNLLHFEIMWAPNLEVISVFQLQADPYSPEGGSLCGIFYCASIQPNKLSMIITYGTLCLHNPMATPSHRCGI